MKEELKDKMRKYCQEIRKKTNINNSYKPPLKINNYFTDINEEDSKYYQLNYPEIKCYQNKNNMNKFEKRKNYIVPKVYRNEIEEDEENSKEDENNERNKLINQLIYNSEINYVQDFRRKAQEDTIKELKNIKDRIEVLQKNNIDINYLLESEEENEKKEENEIENINEENKNEIINKEEKKNFDIEIENNQNIISDSNYNDNKKEKLYLKAPLSIKRKPNVNSLEFYQKVKKYLNNKEKDSKINNDENDYENNINQKINLLEPYNKQMKKKKNYSINYINDSFKPELKLNYKRTKEELQDYMKKKDEKRKENEIKQKEEEKNKDLNNYRKLAELQKTINNNKNKIKLGKNNKKVINGYYVGSNKKNTFSRESSKSTVLEKNEYYKNIIESLEIIVNENKQNEKKNIKMSKENYDKFIDDQENKIKNGELGIINKNNNIDKYNKKVNKKNKPKKIKENNSFNKEIQNSETLRNNDLIKKNNLNRFFEPHNENKEKLNNKTNNENQLKKEKVYSEEKNKINHSENNIIKTKKNPEKQFNSKMKKIISKDNKKEKNIKKPNKRNIKNNIENQENDNINKTKDYQFTQEELEIYNQILEELSEFLNKINKKNAFNDIISYGNNRFRYIVGIQRLILIFKFYPFNAIISYGNLLFYYEAFKQIFYIYISKAFYKILKYSKNIQKHDKKNIKNENKSLNNILNNKNKKEIEIKIKNAINKLEYPIKVYTLQKIFDYAYQDLLKEYNHQKNDISEYSDNSDSFPIKNHTYLYESFSEKNSIILYPNSVDSDRLHRVYKLLEMQKSDSDISDDDSYISDDNYKNHHIDLSNSFKYKNNSKIKNKNKYKNLEDDEIKIEKIAPSIGLLNIKDEDKKKLSDNLTEEIIDKIIKSEITNNNILLLPKKNPNSFFSLSNSINNSPNKSLINSQNIDSFPFGNNSVYSNQNDLNNSIFMRPISEIQRDKSLNLYNDIIAPRLIKKISKEIDSNYEQIINNLKQPFKINETKLMNGILLKDKEIISNPNSVYINKQISNLDYLNKEKIKKDFTPLTKKIREENENDVDSNYDNILNECLIDTANELIENERIYGEIGEPIKWSLRDKIITFKYTNDNLSKNQFKKKICKQLRNLTNFKMALIPENYENIDPDLIASDREKKFFKSINEELKNDKKNWEFFESEETQIKLLLSKIIMDQLLNEVIEIMEHVQLSRKEPNKYQNKSIYACDDIPRLSFQNTTENNDDADNDNINQ